MGTVVIFVFCIALVVIAKADVTLKADRPSLRVPVSDQAILECCFTNGGVRVDVIWIIQSHNPNNSRSLQMVNVTDNVTWRLEEGPPVWCGVLTFKSVQLEDNGLYQCALNGSSSKLLTHGTYLQVYTPMKKTINLRESTKNKILTAEGVLLLLCVLLPSASLLFKSKKLHELENRKMKREEENIYQGLNLDDCCNTYDQIERKQVQSPYEDVENMMEEDEEIELEKP